MIDRLWFCYVNYLHYFFKDINKNYYLNIIIILIESINENYDGKNLFVINLFLSDNQKLKKKFSVLQQYFIMLYVMIIILVFKFKKTEFVTFLRKIYNTNKQYIDSNYNFHEN